ncbi:MAG: aminotransferase class V-fold PLP-dependent enzyme [Cyanobacteriota bacterium]|nr:aminotransferase class V-fold PLP-dependent enzyme [Cyanobacteriota bacterium]
MDQEARPEGSNDPRIELGRFPFGAKVRHYWRLDEEAIFLNHGSFGATPSPVLAAQAAWRERMERQPVLFLAGELPDLQRQAAAVLAEFVGSRPENLVFVDNATTGVNAVLRGLDWHAGDRVAATDHLYGAVGQTLTYLAQRHGYGLDLAHIPFPLRDERDILTAWAAVLTPQTRLAVFDHITSASGLIFPIAQMISLCRAQGIPVLVDGAHAPGMIPLDLENLAADWYVGNAHKWLCAPKGCGFLWTHPQHQAQTHPTVISHGYGSGYLAEFDWVGTKDPSSWLAVSAAIEFQHHLGSAAIRQHNQALALWAGEHLSRAWGSPLPAPVGMLGSMVAIPLDPQQMPVPPQASLSQLAQQIHDWLWQQHRIEVPVYSFQDRLWLRISAQVYNQPHEYERLADVLGKGGIPSAW